MMKLNNEQLQVILTGTFGDGGIRRTIKTGNYTTSCKMKDYLEFKLNLLGDLSNGITYVDKNGYSQTYIWTLRTIPTKEIKEIHDKSLLEKLNLLDELGIALWMYDDGSIHKKHKFYNLNTHSFSESDNQIISNFLNEKLGIYSRVMIERKKDGRIFYYLHIPTCGGAYKLSEIMSKYFRGSYDYKLYSDEEISKYKALHEYTDNYFKAGTKEHFEKVKSLNRVFLKGVEKYPNLSMEELVKIL